MRLVQDREARLATLDASIARGIADADAGRITSAKAALSPAGIVRSEALTALTCSPFLLHS